MDNKNIVETKSGRIQGLSEKGLKIVKGIPYAEPPVEELRFRPSIPKKPATKILDCTQFGPIAPQRIDTFVTIPAGRREWSGRGFFRNINFRRGNDNDR